jgi:hypothetical protein
MQTRALLRSQLAIAWQKTIDLEYSEQLINSERGLQIYFCRHLLDEFKSDEVSRRLFIEPRITLPEVGVARYPDIVICHTRSIIGVVELKYLPRARADFTKDLKTLEWLSENGMDVVLSNDRYRGVREESRKFSLAPDAVLCWAGVYTSPEESIRLPEARTINERVLVLQAITKSGSPPVIVK